MSDCVGLVLMFAGMLLLNICNHDMIADISSIQFKFSFEVNMYHMQLTANYMCLEHHTMFTSHEYSNGILYDRCYNEVE